MDIAIQLLSMSFYTKQLRWVDAGAVCSALIITKLVTFTSLIEEQWLGTMFTAFLYFLDFSIFTAVVVAVQGKGGVAVFYFLRAGNAISAPDHSVSRSLLPAVIVFGLLRAGQVVLDHFFLLSAQKTNNSSKEEREIMRTKQQKVKYFFLIFLSLIVFIFTFMVTLSVDGMLPGLLFLGCIASIVVELSKMNSLPLHSVRLIRSSLHINFYIIVLLCWLIGYKTSNSSIKYLIPAFIYLSVLLLNSRLLITLFTNKFHSIDGDLFYAVYPFADHTYNLVSKSDEGQLRLAKAVDRLSRQLAFLIYMLGVCLSSVDSNPIWITIGVIAVNVYQIQNSQSGLQAVIEQKIKIRLRFLLLMPLIIFYYHYYNQQHCRRQTIESMITNCGNSLRRQLTLCAAMSFVAIISQAIKARQYKVLLLKGVAILCPLVILLLCMGLECQNLGTMLISGYSLAICLQIIREDRRSVIKRGKDE